MRRSARTEPRPPSFLATWVPRVGVLAALGAATIAVPVVDAATAQDDGPSSAAVALGPTAFDVLSAPVDLSAPTSMLAPAPQVQRVEVVSRSFDRDPLPGCSGEGITGGENGRIPASQLCELWASGQSLRGDAAVALAELNRSFEAAFGRNLCITDSYRSLSEQYSVAARKPGLAARPGSSNHGWGLAIDLCSHETRSSAVMDWLYSNGPAYGWDNPDWARPGGSGPREEWHWEYEPGTIAMGTDYSR